MPGDLGSFFECSESFSAALLAQAQHQRAALAGLGLAVVLLAALGLGLHGDLHRLGTWASLYQPTRPESSAAAVHAIRGRARAQQPTIRTTLRGRGRSVWARGAPVKLSAPSVRVRTIADRVPGRCRHHRIPEPLWNGCSVTDGIEVVAGYFSTMVRRRFTGMRSSTLTAPEGQRTSRRSTTSAPPRPKCAIGNVEPS